MIVTDFVPYTIVHVTKWSRTKTIGTALKNFVFRGQENKDWALETSLHRAIEKNNKKIFTSVKMREENILRVFKARAHNYLQSPPPDDKNIEWLSIIQDYGGPTRLLDFTESFYIATFFALEESSTECAIWCINFDKLYAHAIDKGINLDSVFAIENKAEEYIGFNGKSQSLILRITPPRLNQRLAMQKGTFLFPCDTQMSFEENLCKTFDFPFTRLTDDNAVFISEDDTLGKIRKSYIVKVVISRETRGQALEDLFAMNIDAATLFPDLSGFARSLRFHTRDYHIKDVEIE